VDEIEKGLVKELARAPLKVTTQGYRHTVACNIGPGPDPSGTLERSRPAATPAEGPERRSGE
jgi:hypothetical protein